MNERKVRVRFAPSPTGPLHIGGVRTALYNYLFAKHHNGRFILRIEDTDRNRFVSGAEEYINNSLEWLNIAPDESPDQEGEHGPYRQSERTEIYQEMIQLLIKNGSAYYAFDTPEELDAKRNEDPNWTYGVNERSEMRNSVSLSEDEVQTLLESGAPYTIRAKIPANEQVIVEDAIRGRVEFDSNLLDDKVLLKNDGYPTYHLANVVDDHLMEISHVIRGEEWLSSAALHTLLYKFFGWSETQPVFAHLPLILKPEGKGKLSKRDGEKGGFPVFPLTWQDPVKNETSIGYKESGYFPEAVVNMLALLGWNPGTEQEIFSLDDLCKAFTLDRVNKSGARFDPEKAKWFNQEYLKEKTIGELSIDLKSSFDDNGNHVEIELAEQIVELMKERSSFVSDMKNVPYLFNGPDEFDEKTHRKKWKEQTPELLGRYALNLSGLEIFDPEKIEEHFKSFLESNEIGMGAVMPNLRLVLTGMGSGPSLYKIMSILGKEECLRRIESGIERLK